MKSVFISCGEVSGDRYGAQIAENLINIDPDVKIYGIGGKAMLEAGVELIYNIRDIEAMGFVEVLRKLPVILKIINRVSAFIINNDIDVFAPIDNPDFNFRVIKKIKKSRTAIFYFIPPQIWAWRKNRVNFLKKQVDKMGVIFPFEAEFYAKYGIKAVFSGHPLAERYIGNEFSMDKFEKKYRKIISGETPFNLALLPGSRETEIKAMLPVLLSTHQRLKNHFPTIKSHIPVSPNVDHSLVEHYIKELADDIILHDDVDKAFKSCDFAVIASGTATLQASLYPIPFILVYKMHSLSFLIAKFFARLNKTRFIGITNIILNNAVIPEYIQDEASPENLSEAVFELLADFESLKNMFESFRKLRNILYCKDSISSVSLNLYKMLNHKDLNYESIP